MFMTDDRSKLWDQRKWNIYISCLTPWLLIATITLSLRIWMRVKITRSIGLEDHLLIAAHVINIIASGLWLHLRKIAMHVEDNSVESYELLSMPAFISLALYVLAGILAKASIALWFLTTARSRVQRILIIVPLGLYLLACSICFVLVLFRCGLPADPAIFFNVADCTIGPDVIYYSSWVVASLNSVCDWVFAAVPLYMVIKSQTMTQTARILASSLIGLAIVGSIVSVCRLPFLGAAKFGPHFLTSSVTAIAFMLSLIETAVAVTTISLATLQPLLAVLRRRWTVFRSRSVTRASSAGPMPPRCNNQPLPTDVVADMMRSGTVVKSTQRSTYDTKVRLDSEALGGIGILPDVSLHDSEDEDDNGLVQFLPRKRSIAMSVGVVTAMISIAEAADSPEISPDTEKDEYIGRMVRRRISGVDGETVPSSL